MHPVPPKGKKKNIHAHLEFSKGCLFFGRMIQLSQRGDEILPSYVEIMFLKNAL